VTRLICECGAFPARLGDTLRCINCGKSVPSSEDSQWYIPGPPHGPATVPEPPRTRKLRRVLAGMGQDAIHNLTVVAWEGLAVLTDDPARFAASDKDGAD
jgi:hypothetical protein